jgi:hypothetical protein
MSVVKFLMLDIDGESTEDGSYLRSRGLAFHEVGLCLRTSWSTSHRRLKHHHFPSTIYN